MKKVKRRAWSALIVAFALLLGMGVDVFIGGEADPASAFRSKAENVNAHTEQQSKGDDEGAPRAALDFFHASSTS